MKAQILSKRLALSVSQEIAEGFLLSLWSEFVETNSLKIEVRSETK